MTKMKLVTSRTIASESDADDMSFDNDATNEPDIDKTPAEEPEVIDATVTEILEAAKDLCKDFGLTYDEYKPNVDYQNYMGVPQLTLGASIGIQF